MSKKGFYFISNAESKKGIGDLMKSEEMQEMLLSKAKQITNKAGKGYHASSSVGTYISFGYAKTGTIGSYYDNLKNNSLIKAMNSSAD